ncbi:hypothetical protein QTP88_007558 [Uroleucon formosanum]
MSGLDIFRNTVVKQKHVVEEQEKKRYSKIKYQPRNPELKRLISSEETIGTPKHSHQKSTTNSPLPKGVINLDINATKYLPTTQPNNCFGIYYDKDFDDYKIGKNRLQFISAEERAGNNNFHNEKLGILHLFKTIMENIIDTPEAITTATALAEGVSAVYSAVTDAQHKKRIEQETI